MAVPDEAEREEYRRVKTEEGRNAQIYALVHKTPLGKLAYLWERVDAPYLMMGYEYVDRWHPPKERPFLKSDPEPLRFMAGPFNEAGEVQRMSREEALAAVQILGEAERSLASQVGYPRLTT